jgi:GT2 family glycosyltransferase
MTHSARLAVILVNWNGSDDTLNCLESISTSTYQDYFVVVVDNGSRSDQLQKLRQSKSAFKLIETGENLGYTGGNNKGIEYALECKAEYVLLLNNDTYIAVDTLTNVMRAADLDKRIGILSPKIYFHPARHLIWSAGTVLNKRFLMGYLTGYKVEDKGQFDEAREVDYVTGCAMLIQSKVISEVGMLCDDYFAVCEDLDYCLRTRMAGYRITYEPSASVWHIESASSGGHEAPQYVYYQTRNYFLFHNRWANGIIQLISSQSYCLVWTVKRSLSCLLRGKWKVALGILYGIRDVILGRLGRRDYAVLAKKKG